MFMAIVLHTQTHHKRDRLSANMQSFHSRADPTVPSNGTVWWTGQDEMDALWRRRHGCTCFCGR